MTITPDGREVWVPDNLAPLPFPPPQQIGPPMGIQDETAQTAGQQETPSVTGGALPSQGQQQAPPPVPQPDFLAQTIDNDPKVMAAKDAAYAKQQAAQDKAQAKAQAQQAAFNASPEGKAQNAGADQAAITQGEGDLARAQGQVESAELTDAANAEREGFRRAEKVRSDAAVEQAARAAGLMEKSKQLDQAVKAEAEYKIDDNRRWKEMGTGRTVTFWIMAALSGLGDALQRKSGPNMVLSMMNSAIENDVNAQARERDTLGKRIGIAKNSIDNYRQITGDKADAQRLKLSEEYERTAQQIRATAAKYGSDKAKIRGEQLAMQFEGQAAAIRGTTAEGVLNRDLQRQQMANARANTNIAGGHLALANKQFKEGIRQFDKRMELDAAQLDVEAQKAAAAGQGKAAEAMRELGVAAPPRLVTDAEGNITGIDRNTGGLRQGDGSVWLIPTKEEAIKFREAKASADSIVDILDEIRGIRNRVGGESAWGNSDDYQRLATLKENLVLLRKAGTQGMSSNEDMVRIERALGAKDPASFRAQTAGLDEGRAQVVKQINAKARALQYSGDDITYADPTKLSPELQADDLAFKDSLKDYTKGAMGANKAATAEQEGKPDAGSPYATDIDAVYRFNTEGTTKAQRKTIQGLVDTATDASKSQAVRDAARARLQQGAQQGQGGARDAYRSALATSLPNDAAVSREEPTGAVR